MSDYEYLKSKTWFITTFENELKHPKDVIYDISCENSTEKRGFSIIIKYYVMKILFQLM